MNRMAGGTNGLDLSGTHIIMDYIAIKNSPFMQLVFQAVKYCCAGLVQNSRSGC